MSNYSQTNEVLFTVD